MTALPWSLQHWEGRETQKIMKGLWGERTTASDEVQKGKQNLKTKQKKEPAQLQGEMGSYSQQFKQISPLCN